MQDEVLQVYIDSLRDKYKVTVNHDLLKTMYDKTASAGDAPDAGGDQ